MSSGVGGVGSNLRRLVGKSEVDELEERLGEEERVSVVLELR